MGGVQTFQNQTFLGRYRFKCKIDSYIQKVRYVLKSNNHPWEGIPVGFVETYVFLYGQWCLHAPEMGLPLGSLKGHAV